MYTCLISWRARTLLIITSSPPQIPIYAAALLAFFVPFVFFVIMQIRRRSFHDLTATTIGLLMSLITAAVFQVFLKWLIGGFRPHFLAVCKPVITPELAGTGTGFGGIMFDRSVCTGDEHEINDALESFPSGHSTAAGAGFVYLSLYLNAMLKIWSDHHPAYWKHVLVFAPLLGAALIAGSLTIDKYHHAHDVIGGLFIGTLCAFGAYRMVFAAVWDFRFNHILLPRQQSLCVSDTLIHLNDSEADQLVSASFLRHPKTSAPGRFDYSLGSSSTAPVMNEKAGAHGHHSHGHGAGVNAPFTRDGGWGVVSSQQGAPGDAAFGGAGSHGGLGEQRDAGYV